MALRWVMVRSSPRKEENSPSFAASQPALWRFSSKRGLAEEVRSLAWILLCAWCFLDIPDWL